MPWDPEEEQHRIDDAWLMGQLVTVALIRLIVREELYRLTLITQEQRDQVARTFGEESGFSA